MGDLNEYHTFWASKVKNNSKKVVTERSLAELNQIVVLNDGRPTRFTRP